MTKKLRLFFIGLMMGIADIIPGISGGTVAFLAGIYEELLLSIQSLQLHSPKKIAWGFLLPLGGGIGCGFFSLAQAIHFLLSHSLYHIYLYALFFGLIAASAWQCGKKAEMKTVSHWGAFFAGAIIAFFLCGKLSVSAHFLSFGGLFIAGALAAGAMLLPGISGSYLLCLLGVYPVAMGALVNLSEGWKILLPLGLGISVGLMGFSRGIHWLIKYFRSFTLALLTGFMAGGLRSVWPFEEGHISLVLIISVIGVGFVFLLERFSNFIVKAKG